MSKNKYRNLLKQYEEKEEDFLDSEDCSYVKIKKFRNEKENKKIK